MISTTGDVCCVSSRGTTTSNHSFLITGIQLRKERYYIIRYVQQTKIQSLFMKLISSLLFLFLFLLIQNANAMVAYYNGSVIAALLHLFPEIGLERSKFANTSSMLVLSSFSSYLPSRPLPLSLINLNRFLQKGFKSKEVF